MSDNSENNKRIAKNTGLLYIRMLVTMAISLYTSRLVLAALGVVDFGVYNAVGGVVSTMMFLNTLLASSSQRFITFALGKNDNVELKRTVANCLSVHAFLALIIFIVCETLGLWFVNAKLNIPEGSIYAANWVYQFSVATICCNIMIAPYNAMIIAHEKMSAFAYISILDVVIKLISVYILLLVPSNRLIFYGLYIMLVALLNFFIYIIYCRKHFDEGCTKPAIDRDMFRSVLSFSGYNSIEVFSNMLSDQGLNIILNILFGPTVNAARGIALQVNNAVNGFINNFTTALNPQITKSYAANEVDRMRTLMLKGNRLCFMLLLILVLPLFFRIDYILILWLETPPEYSGAFIRLLFVYFLLIMLTRSFFIGISATGDIKAYQLTLGCFRLTLLPICYILLKTFDCQPTYAYYIIIVYEIIGIFIKVHMIRRKIDIPINILWIDLFRPCIVCGILSFISAYFLNVIIPTGFIGLLCYASCSILSASLIIWFLGIRGQEKQMLINFVRNKIKQRA